MSTKSEEKNLVKALHRGDRYACDDLVSRYSGKIYSVALRLTGHPAEAEEVLQETFINACRSAERFKGKSSLGTWLYRIATNNSLMRLRRRDTPTVPLDTGSEENNDEFWPRQFHDWHWNPESITLNEELRQAMDEAIDTLPDNLRPIFVLRDLEGLSTKEAAEALDITTSNAKVRLHRARLMLREQLARYFNGHPENGGDHDG